MLWSHDIGNIFIWGEWACRPATAHTQPRVAVFLPISHVHISSECHQFFPAPPDSGWPSDPSQTDRCARCRPQGAPRGNASRTRCYSDPLQHRQPRRPKRVQTSRRQSRSVPRAAPAVSVSPRGAAAGRRTARRGHIATHPRRPTACGPDASHMG